MKSKTCSSTLRTKKVGVIRLKVELSDRDIKDLLKGDSVIKEIQTKSDVVKCEVFTNLNDEEMAEVVGQFYKKNPPCDETNPDEDMFA